MYRWLIVVDKSLYCQQYLMSTIPIRANQGFDGSYLLIRMIDICADFFNYWWSHDCRLMIFLAKITSHYMVMRQNMAPNKPLNRLGNQRNDHSVVNHKNLKKPHNSNFEELTKQFGLQSHQNGQNSRTSLCWDLHRPMGSQWDVNSSMTDLSFYDCVFHRAGSQMFRQIFKSTSSDAEEIAFICTWCFTWYV